MTDVQLIEGYVLEQSEDAFRALVERHGPTVLRACRRVLHDPHEIEDAFQSTFLVLMDKAPTVRDPRALGNWLYGVALRVASQARRNAARRRRHERQRAEADPTRANPELPLDDLHLVVHEELGRLPEVYRLPLSLCYLDGRSHEQAAEELGLPLGTLKIRLVRGRDRLRARLDRRKISVGAGLLLWLLSRTEAEACSAVVVGPGVGQVESQGAHLLGQGLDSATRPRWLWPLLLLLAMTLAASLGVQRQVRARALERDLFVSLPASLTDVLNVECR